MTAPAPMLFSWDGEYMVPLNRRAADRQYVVGATYRLEHREERSSQTHAHYFAALEEAWRNLPEDITFASADHLRKAALIHCGFRDERSIVTSSKAEAQRLAAFIRPMDEYAIISTSGATVVVLTAKSQSMRAMGKAEFQRSKEAVLSFVASLLGTTSEGLQEAAVGLMPEVR